MSSAQPSAQPKSAHIDPVAIETPEMTPNMNSQEAKASMFIKAVDKVIKANKSSKPGTQSI